MKSLCSVHPLGWQQILAYHTNIWEWDECSFNLLLRFLEQLNSALDPFTGLNCAGNESGLCDHWSRTAKMERYSDLYVSVFSNSWKSTQYFLLKNSIRLLLAAEGQCPFCFWIYKKENCNYPQIKWTKADSHIFGYTSLYNVWMQLILYCTIRACCYSSHLTKLFTHFIAWFKVKGMS